ncbi:hypothetical protein PTKIN_Ptkin11bG0010600 [Pterospermum kingtungense]
MGKKMLEKDGKNNQVEEGNAVEKGSNVLDVLTGNMNGASESCNREDDKNKKKEDNNEKKKGRIKKRKSDFDTDEKESQKAQKKHKKKNTDQESNGAMYSENNFDCEAKRVRKDKHKNKNRDGIDAVATVTETLEHQKLQEPVEVQKICSYEDVNKVVNGQEGEHEKPKKKKKKQKLEKASGNVADHIEVMSCINGKNGTDKEDSAGKEVECSKLGGAGKKKKSKSVKSDSEGKHHKGDATTRKSVKTTNQSENAMRDKKVSFSDHVDVFPRADVIDGANKDDKKGLVYARRYSKEEDQIIRNAVANYIESHNLGDEGINMVMNCKLHPELKNCWKDIQAAIPWRPHESVYQRAHAIFERDEKRPWTLEEYEIVQKFVKEHGPKWKFLADSLGKYSHHVRDTWRRIKLANRKRGNWSQEEYQNLFDLVNLDLSMKVFEEKKSRHGMLRDNISWTMIGDKMQSRPSFSCCLKWYRSLASPMVKEGIWADADDYRMLDALSGLDACCMEDVDWDNLLEHRSGDVCRKRWNQMVQHLGPDRYNKSFFEQVEILAKRYCPDMLDAREAFDSKRPVDLP